MRTCKAGQANGELDRALQRFGSDEGLWAAKAAILQGAGDARGAYACLAPLAERAQAPPTILVRAGLAALEFDPANAVNLAARALRVLPDSVPARTLLAAAQLGTGDARGALENCTALLADDPDEQYLIALQTTAWRLLGDERYAQFCDYQNWSCRSSSRRQHRGRTWTASRRPQGDLNRLHNPHGHALLFQSLRHGTETTEDLSRSADPAIGALFGSFAARSTATWSTSATAPMRCDAAITGAGASTAPGRCGCTARAFMPTTCIRAAGFPRRATSGCPRA
jgi:hypothetical protein